jgi:hypothetical protein
MKKVNPILIIVIYALATMGFSINQFYCCGRLSSTWVTIIEKSKQSCEKSGCCENKSHFVNVIDNHVTSDELNTPIKQLSELHSFFPPFDNITYNRQKLNTIANRSNAPPLILTIVNDDNSVKHGMAAYVILKSGVSNMLSLPSDAVIWDNKGASIWIETSKNVFKNKMVTTGIESGDRIE